MKNGNSPRKAILISFFFFLLISYIMDSVLFALFYPLIAIVREMLNFSFSSPMLLRIFSLFAVAIVSFVFGFFKFFSCRLSGLGASLYLALTWLSMLYSVYFNTYMELSGKTVITISSFYIAAGIIAYYCGFIFCSFSKSIMLCKNLSDSSQEVS